MGYLEDTYSMRSSIWNSQFKNANLIISKLSKTKSNGIKNVLSNKSKFSLRDINIICCDLFLCACTRNIMHHYLDRSFTLHLELQYSGLIFACQLNFGGMNSLYNQVLCSSVQYKDCDRKTSHRPSWTSCAAAQYHFYHSKFWVQYRTVPYSTGTVEYTTHCNYA